MATSGTGLARGAIGLREVLFQSVTSMAPAGAVALSIAAGATYAGGARCRWPCCSPWSRACWSPSRSGS
jgi:hypothetical protein